MKQRQMTITFKNEPVGRLIQQPGDGSTVFEYAPDQVQDIACGLPVSEGVHRWSGGLHPVFQHCSAEGVLRQAQAEASKLDQQDDFGLLAAFGSDCIGAIGFIKDAADEDAPLAAVTAANPPSGLIAGRTISGVQLKRFAYELSAGKFVVATENSPATHIAKIAEARLPNIVGNECYTLHLAKHVLGADRVTEFQRVDLADTQEDALLLTRFDRSDTGKKIRLEDFAQILKVPRGSDFKGKYQSSHEAIGSAITQFSSAPIIDLVHFFKLVVFNILIGNADAHLKNFSLLEVGDGLRLSPAYDLVNTCLYQQYDRNIALGMNGSKPALEEIVRKDVIAFGRNLGLLENAIIRSLDDVIARLSSQSRSKSDPSDPYWIFVGGQIVRLAA